MKRTRSKDRHDANPTGSPKPGKGWSAILPELCAWPYTTDIATFASVAFRVGQKVGSGLVARSVAEHQLRVAAKARGYEKVVSLADLSGLIELQLSGGALHPAAPAANDNQPPRLPIVEACDLAGEPLIARQFLVERVLPHRTVTLLTGDGGIGKGALTMQLLTSVALGRPFFGLAVTQAKSLYVGAEDELGDLHQRLSWIAEHLKRPLSDFRNIYLLALASQEPLLAVPDRKSDRLTETALFKRIREEAIARQVELLVLDASADVYGGDEVSRNQVRQFIGMLRTFAIENNCAVLLIAHPSVQGLVSGTGLSGSTHWHNSVRSRLYMDCGPKDADPHVRRVRLLKANYSTSGLELMLRWHDGVLVPDLGDDGATAKLLNTKTDKLFLELLTLLNSQGQNVGAAPGTTYAPSIMARHPKAKGVNKKQLAAAMQRLLDGKTILIEAFGPPSRQRRRLVLAA